MAEVTQSMDITKGLIDHSTLTSQLQALKDSINNIDVAQLNATGNTFNMGVKAIATDQDPETPWTSAIDLSLYVTKRYLQLEVKPYIDAAVTGATARFTEDTYTNPDSVSVTAIKYNSIDTLTDSYTIRQNEIDNIPTDVQKTALNNSPNAVTTINPYADKDYVDSVGGGTADNFVTSLGGTHYFISTQFGVTETSEVTLVDTSGDIALIVLPHFYALGVAGASDHRAGPLVIDIQNTQIRYRPASGFGAIDFPMSTLSINFTLDTWHTLMNITEGAGGKDLNLQVKVEDATKVLFRVETLDNTIGGGGVKGQFEWTGWYLKE